MFTIIIDNWKGSYEFWQVKPEDVGVKTEFTNDQEAYNFYLNHEDKLDDRFNRYTIDNGDVVYMRCVGPNHNPDPEKCFD